MTHGPAVVYLVRHGRTALNAAGALRGRIVVPLDEVGQAEAAALGRRGAAMPLAVVLTSPLARARQTASAIAGANGAPIEVDDDLIDRDYGQWAGQPRRDVEARFGSLDDAPGVEAAASVARRVTAALERAADRAGDAAVVVVAHQAVNRIAMAAVVPALGDPATVPQGTGCWNRLERLDGVWSVPVIDAAADDPDT